MCEQTGLKEVIFQLGNRLNSCRHGSHGLFYTKRYSQFTVVFSSRLT